MATTSQTGTQIMKLAPALAVIPVVGWIGGAAAEIVGTIVSIVGSKWNQSPDVRWLIQLYQYYALGDPNATSDNKVNENYTAQAQAYFSVVLGVPIGGRSDLNILQSGDSKTNTPNGATAQKRASDYLAWKNLQGQVTDAQALQAAQIAATLNFKGGPGSWAPLTPAPSTIETTASGSGLVAAIQSNPSTIYIIIAGVVLLTLIILLRKSK